MSNSLYLPAHFIITGPHYGNLWSAQYEVISLLRLYTNYELTNGNERSFPEGEQQPLSTLHRHVSYTKVPLGKSHHSAAILATPLGTYFELTRPSSYLNEWEESHYFNFSRHWGIKTAYKESPVKRSHI